MRGWTIFCADEIGLAHKVTELIEEQTKLIEATNLLVRADLETHETRSEQISDLIRLLADE